MIRCQRWQRSSHRGKVVDDTDLLTAQARCDASGGKAPCIIGKADFALLGYRRHCQTRPFEHGILLLKLKPIRLELVQYTVKRRKVLNRIIGNRLR